MGDSLRNDLAGFWMPFTNNRAFKQQPRLLASAAGVFYKDTNGHEVLDATSGLWCVNAGHARPEIADAVSRQVLKLDYASCFQIAHPLPFELAAALAAEMPKTLDHVFFSNSGSEAIDTALKIALAYHKARGEGTRTRLIGRERGYHGVGFGGISVGGIVNNRRSFGPLLPGVDHLRHTHDPARSFERGQPRQGANLAEDLLRLIALHGQETIAAVVVEPMAGSTGVLPPPVGYLDRLREIATAHGILLIFDEVITGFGRASAMTAAERLGTTPDIVVLAKGISNGTIPMGATVVSSNVHDTIVTHADEGIEFFHGYTSSGHPVAAAAALATLDIFKRDGLCTRAAAIEPYWEDAVHSLADAPNVIDIRNFGLAAGIELAPIPDRPGARASAAFAAAFDAGVLIRTTGDTIALSPPLTIERTHIDRIVETVRTALTANA